MRLLVVILLVGVTGVAASDDAGLSAAELKRADKLVKQRCYRCHKLYDPHDYSKAEWDKWMGKMSRKARLKEEQEELLNRYFDHLREQPKSEAEAE